MCLIVFAWRPDHPLPLVVAGNRDEFRDRPTRPLAAWDDAPQIIAGRDLRAGGTWMGVAPGGRFAALTNIRAPGQQSGPLSRGDLPERFLRGDQEPLAYLQEVANQREQYAGFNLLVGDAGQLCYLNAQEGIPRAVLPGVYGLSNAALDTPWPKLLNAREALQACLAEPRLEHLLELLADSRQVPDAQLPQTGVSLEMERLLSSVFIDSPDYGTRTSTALIRHGADRFEIIERSFASGGMVTSEVSFDSARGREQAVALASSGSPQTA
ncbi:NRDE family protein [Stutzerimonas azotifigens]|uniref:NRDE family protein n=1 Tax=Stutzerimonas azotifigens TaxID=291995 RepID=A0ABR5YZB8_9GAMM|nr:NRDE family protein [Stutzerimonas azotifigens]MBA1273261.1 NRDE family protein [Stutzerimonas azotifigens]